MENRAGVYYCDYYSIQYKRRSLLSCLLPGEFNPEKVIPGASDKYSGTLHLPTDVFTNFTLKYAILYISNMHCHTSFTFVVDSPESKIEGKRAFS
jgi:hypothetical protein